MRKVNDSFNLGRYKNGDFCALFVYLEGKENV